MPDKKLSSGHRSYLKKLNRDRLIVRLSRVLVLVAMLGLWELATSLGLLDPFIFSSPSRIAATIARLWTSGDLLLHVGTTLFETVLGFLIGTGLGVFFCRAALVVPQGRPGR